MPNNDLLEETMTWIEERPDLHNQDHWFMNEELRDHPWSANPITVPDREDLAACGTSACFAGWAVLLSGRAKTIVDIDHVIAVNGKEEERYVPSLAREILGLDDPTGGELFAGHNTRDELRRMVDYIKEHGNLNGFEFTDDDDEALVV